MPVGTEVVCVVGSGLSKSNIASTWGANDDEVVDSSCPVSEWGVESWPTE